MLGGKGSYCRSILIIQVQSQKNEKIKRKLSASKRRYLKHKKDMRLVDLDEVIKKYAPNAVPFFDGYKIKYSQNESPYIIVADPSGYLRVMDCRTETFVDVYTGETLREDVPDYNKRTHFRIKRREEK